MLSKKTIISSINNNDRLFEVFIWVFDETTIVYIIILTIVYSSIFKVKHIAIFYLHKVLGHFNLII